MTTTVCFAAVDVMLSKKVSLSYKHDNVSYLVLVNDLTIKIKRINNDVARVYFVDGQQVQQPIPANVVMTDAAGIAVAPFKDNYLITWFDSYTLLLDGQPYMVIDNPKQQAIYGPANAASGVM